MIENWQRALEFNLAWEGGYAERPEEPGGAVNKGISFTAFKEFCARHHKPAPIMFDLKNISDEDVSTFYRERADQIEFDSLPAGYDLALFNASTMFGVTEAKLMHTVASGDIGHLMVLQMERKLGERSCVHFGKGWGRRLRLTFETARDLETQSFQATRPGANTL